MKIIKKNIEGEEPTFERVDTFVAQNCDGKFSRSSVGKLISQGRVKLNGEVVKSKALKLTNGDVVEVYYQDPVADEDLRILYESDDEIVISKPAGMLSHAKGPISGEVNVADWLQPKTTDLNVQRSGIVHRLDRATSGVMILAKNPESKSWLMRQFSDRNVHKKYLAIIEGVPDQKKFRIDMPIGRNPKKLTTFYVTESGREAKTDVEVLSTNGKESLVLLSPKTGRTHQLRVHMWANGWPILGDPFYNEVFKDGQELMLHANSLTIQTSDKEWRVFSAPIPSYFLDKLVELNLKLPDLN
ncbi:MAG: RluA family pseudouridine synthase [Candidatus Nomurabacteria bacterium]|nr:MAG: RluA family pseudouridine synthase [Candidatus Nomurabacteria bacterium]